MNAKKFYLLEVLFPRNNTRNNIGNTKKTASKTMFEEQENHNTQKEHVPLSMDDIEKAIQSVIESDNPKEIEKLITIGKELQNLEIQKVETISNRFDGNTYTEPSGISNLSNTIEIEETIEFADEVDKLCESGMDRRTAYIQARYNIYKRR